MSVLENTRPATYKGVQMLVRRARGRRGVVRTNYQLANTKRRVSKAIGGYAPDFMLTCFTHDIDGNKYEQKRDALMRALDDDEAGTLVHPFLGNIYVAAGVYDYDEAFSEIGICKFEVPFFVKDRDGDNPAVSPRILATPGGIKDKALAANRSMQESSANAFKASTGLNKLANKRMLSNMVDGIRGKMSGLADNVQKASAFAGKALAIAEQAQYYADNPLVGFAAVADTLLGVDGLTLDVYSKFRAVQGLFDSEVTSYTEHRIPANPLTFEDAERNVSADASDTFVQSASLFEAYSQSANVPFKNVQEINDAAEVLETQFERIKQRIFKSRPDYGNVVPDYDDAYEKMNDLRIDAMNHFEQLRITAPKLQVIKVNSQPASVLSYSLYGTSARAEEIMDLNGLTDMFDVSGEIVVLSK